VNAFHVCGALLAIWALIAAFLGITREGFPGSPAAERVVAAISITLVVAAIGTAVYTSATEDDEPDEGQGGNAALVR
jgi:hypothetical protein